MAGTAYYILQTLILKAHGPDSILAKAIGKDLKGKASPILYVIGIISGLFTPWIAGAIYIFVAFIWLVPDKRIEIIFRNDPGS